MKAIFVVGPTASGKSQLAIMMAEKFGGSIINCDSIQCYTHLKIGSSAPSDEDLKRVPHYMYTYVNPPIEMTAGQFLRDFYHFMDTNKKIKGPLFIVGGTGFYVQALEKGMFNVPQIDPNLKQQIEDEIKEYGNERAYQELTEFDPETKIHVNDAYRIGRALEVKRAFNLKMSELKIQSLLSNDETDATKLKLPFPFIKIGVQLDKEALHAQIAQRTKKMLKVGFIDEVKSLIAAGYSEWAPMESVGYFEIKEFLAGRLKESELEEMINQSTRQLTKKQKNWFKRDLDTNWVNPQSESSIHDVMNKVENFLKD